MKTDAFISLLSAGIKPIDRHLQRKVFTRAIVLGGAGSLLLMLMLFGVRADIHLMLMTPLFWLKMALPLVLAATSLLLLTRASRPGVAIGSYWLAPALPVLVLWLAALVILLATPQMERYPLIMGVTWKQCPFNIALLSIPACVALVWAVRQLAPTRLRTAGLLTGLLASSLATMAYCLHCPEMGVPFWALWYVLGMLIPAALGWLLGPLLLRW